MPVISFRGDSIPNFFAFLKKKRRLPPCRTFSFSVVPPTSLTYTYILIGQKPISIKNGQFANWHTTQFFLYKNMQ